VRETLAFMRDLACFPASRGEVVTRFEAAFAAYIGVPHVLFVPSGRMGLWLILKALQYPAGSEIVVPAFTYFAIPAVIRAAGFTPVYADIDPATYELTTASVSNVVTSKTRAVIPTHLFGRTCDMDGLATACSRNHIDLIEDCAQSCGAAIGGRKTGSLGRAAYFTFGITKNFTTFSGAMVACRDVEIHQRMAGLAGGFRPAARGKLLKEAITAFGMLVATNRFIFNLSLAPLVRTTPADRPDIVHRLFEEVAGAIDPAAMDRMGWYPVESQAAAGLRQLRTIDVKNAARRRHGARLLRLLRDQGFEGVPAPAETGGDHIYMSFAIRHPDRFRLAASLRRGGVDVAPGYMIDCSARPELGGHAGQCPNASVVESSILHLPIYPELRDRDLEIISQSLGQP